MKVIDRIREDVERGLNDEPWRNALLWVIEMLEEEEAASKVDEELEMETNEMRSEIFGKMLQIDTSDLQSAWLNQAGLLMYYSEQAADARAAADIARFRLDKTEAEVSAAVRKTPSDFGLDKLTETSISNAVKMSKEYEKAILEKIETNRQAETLKAVVIALDHRKKALENLCYMTDKAWNAEPHVYPKRTEKKERATGPKVIRKSK